MNRLASTLQTSLISCFASLCVLLTMSVSHASEQSPLEVFNQRILPIFQSENPSSCVQCHLASVDLKNYILASSDATFVSLRDQGLIDLDRPERSKILELIRMGDKDRDEPAKLIHEDTRKAELAGFAAWINACCNDPKTRELPTAAKLAKPVASNEVIRHARKSRVVDSFVRNVWSQRMRCFPCHTPHEIDPENPKHQAAIKTRKKFSEQYSAEMLERLDIFRETPEATLAYLIEASRGASSDRLPMIDFRDPRNSLLIQKPMSKLPPKKEDGTLGEPSYKAPVSHMGGLKLHENDQSYKSLITWIQDYGNVIDGKYKSIDELPADNWFPTQFFLRLTGAPESWADLTPVQLFLHEWDAEREEWSDQPVAFTQSVVVPRRVVRGRKVGGAVNGTLFLLGNGDEERTQRWREEPNLPRGRYLVKVYVDSEGKIAEDPTAILQSKDFQGEVEIPKARWRPGFRAAQVVAASKLTSDE